MISERMQFMKNNVYNREFYITRDHDTEYSAKKILSIVNDIFQLNSAVDIGCGVGTWLRVFKEMRGEKAIIAGYDGSYAGEYLVIDKNNFYPVDLETIISPKQKYDLAISLEVAEHLSKERAESFVHDLCEFSDVVLFSAATKGQGGDGHINEQRLDFWKELFNIEGYLCLDIIRNKIWSDPDIPFWYKQNTVLFIKKEVAMFVRMDLTASESWNGESLVHPDLFEDTERRRLQADNKIYLIRKYIDALECGLLQKVYEGYSKKKVLVYGLNEIGKLLFNDMKTHGIDVYGVDRNRDVLKNKLQFCCIEDAPDVDEIIITSLIHYNEIKEICKLRAMGNTAIWRIDDWLNATMEKR